MSDAMYIHVTSVRGTKLLGMLPTVTLILLKSLLRIGSPFLWTSSQISLLPMALTPSLWLSTTCLSNPISYPQSNHSTLLDSLSSIYPPYLTFTDCHLA